MGTPLNGNAVPFTPGMKLTSNLNPWAKPFVPLADQGGGAAPPPQDLTDKPKSPDDVRGLVRAGNPAKEQVGKFLQDRVSELDDLGLAEEVDGQQDLVPFLARSMKLVATANGQQVKADYTSEAESQIVGNSTTALTTYDDRFIALKGGEAFDKLHELVHICSAQGGVSALMGFKLQMNEGAINFFSEQAAPHAGCSVPIRYATETQVVKRLVAADPDNGVTNLFKATFHGDIDPFWNGIAAAVKTPENKWPSGKTMGYSEKQGTANDLAMAIKAKVKNWDTKWLEERFVV